MKNEILTCGVSFIRGNFYMVIRFYDGRTFDLQSATKESVISELARNGAQCAMNLSWEVLDANGGYSDHYLSYTTSGELIHEYGVATESGGCEYRHEIVEADGIISGGSEDMLALYHELRGCGQA